MDLLNKTVVNSKTGQQYKFLQTSSSTNGKLLEIESSFAGKSKQPPMHYHPIQHEEFKVLEGVLNVILNGESRKFAKGESFRVNPRVHHAMWNESDQHTIVNWKITPALDSEKLFVTFANLANDDMTNEEGMPPVLHAAVILKKFNREFRLSKPPWVIQQIVFGILAAAGRMMGYKPVHP